MTLVLGVISKYSIWMLTDRRLSVGGQPVKEDARKLMFLETKDGVAILGYAGLGATALGTEPSDWMAKVLRGRNLSLEQSLRTLAAATQAQLPRHLAQVDKRHVPSPHHIIVPALVGAEPRLYTIDLFPTPEPGRFQFRHVRVVSNYSPHSGPQAPRFAIGGSGAFYLVNKEPWKRDVLRLVRSCDQGKVSAKKVADRLSKLNYDVHLAAAKHNDNSVGPSCIIAWRFSRSGVHKGGGGQRFYTGPEQGGPGAPIPTIASGMDVQALVTAMMPHFMSKFEAFAKGESEPELDEEALKAALARLPDKPDERLD